MTARSVVVYVLGMLAILYCFDKLFFRRPRVTRTFNIGAHVRLKHDGKNPDRFEVTVEEHQDDLRQLSQGPRTAEQWQALFAVYVDQGPQHTQKDQLPMLGSYDVENDRIFFEPRFPLTPGTRYLAVLDLGQLPSHQGVRYAKMEQRFEVPRPTPAAMTVVSHVYPTRALLPENQLKLYLHFSAPMSQGEAYQHVHLVDASGKDVEAPFLRLDEELWDPAGQRFTLFFDPGRVKRELKPREELGPSLVAGKKYTFVIDRDWPDAKGNPLKEAFRKTFEVGPPDEQQPDPAQWKLQPPVAGTTEPLRVSFPEPLDHALLHRMVWVVDGQGRRVPGTVTVSDEETRWSLTPEKPWTAGKYRLVIDATIEDLAGNTIAKLFEVDVFKSVGRQITTETVERPFEVQAK